MRSSWLRTVGARRRSTTLPGSRRPVLSFALLGFLLLGLAACGSGPRTVTVSAASSLTEVAADWEDEFETLNPDVDVVVNLGGSATLREQILEGAPIDLFASANESTVAQLADAGLTEGDGVVFATNSLSLAVPAGNPAAVNGLEDLARDGVRVGLCTPGVPCGDLAAALLAGAGIDASVVTLEPNVRSLLTKIETGELDAGLVYATDIAASNGDVSAIPIESAVDNRYPIVRIAGSENNGDAERFVQFTLSQQGRAILALWGFETP